MLWTRIFHKFWIEILSGPLDLEALGQLVPAPSLVALVVRPEIGEYCSVTSNEERQAGVKDYSPNFFEGVFFQRTIATPDLGVKVCLFLVTHAKTEKVIGSRLCKQLHVAGKYTSMELLFTTAPYIHVTSRQH